MILINRFPTTALNFLKLYPAAGLSVCGIIFSLLHPLFSCLCLFLLPLKSLRKYLICGLLFSLNSHFSLQKLPNETLQLQGYFFPLKDQFAPSFFKTCHIVKGILKTTSKTYSISLPLSEKTAFLNQPVKLFVQLHKDIENPKIVITSFESLNKPAYLYPIRKRISSFFYEHLQVNNHSESSHLFYSLITGTLDNKLLKIKFSFFGLAHILALSGFHINLLYGFSNFIFKIFFKDHLASTISILCILLYVVYIGLEPSIIRSFTMALCSYCHRFFSFHTKPLHSFCVSIIVCCILCPHTMTSPGFCLTFIATLSLIFFQETWHYIEACFGNHKSLYERFILKWLKLVILQLCVFLFTLPCVLYFFQKTNLSSIFFNLFFPSLISLFMITCCGLAIIKLFLPILGNFCLKKTYLTFDNCLRILESPNLAGPFVWDFPIHLSLFLIATLLEIYLVFHVFKKNKVI